MSGILCVVKYISDTGVRSRGGLLLFGVYNIVSMSQGAWSMWCRKLLSVSEVVPIESCRLCRLDRRE